MAVHSPRAHRFQPFEERSSSSVKIQIPEKEPRLIQLGSEVHTGTVSRNQGPQGTDMAARSLLCRQGVGKAGGVIEGQADTTQGAGHPSFTPRKRAHATALHQHLSQCPRLASSHLDALLPHGASRPPQGPGNSLSSLPLFLYPHDSLHLFCNPRDEGREGPSDSWPQAPRLTGSLGPSSPTSWSVLFSVW